MASVPIARDRRRRRSSLVCPETHENPGETALSTAPRIDIDLPRSGTIPIPRWRSCGRRRRSPSCRSSARTLLCSRDDIFDLREADRRVLLASAGRADEQADGPQHDAQGRRGAHGRAARDLSDGVAEDGEGALDRAIPGACRSHHRCARAAGHVDFCATSRCRSRPNA